MSHATPNARELAGQLIAAETKERSAPEPGFPPAFYVCEMLRPRFATLMGKAGFHALLSRALSLASAEAPWLRALCVQPDGSLGGWEKPEAQAGPRRLHESGILLVAQLLGLLIAFIGENLTRRLVHEVWPALPIQDSPRPPGDHP